MALHKVINVRDGDPIETIREVLRIPLENSLLDSIFLPVWTEDTQHPTPELVSSPEHISSADPFAPVMFCNSASTALHQVERNLQGRIGIVLRPCELRTFQFLVSESGLQAENAILISMDCLATFPLEDFGWRLDKADERDKLTKTALHFAAQGGLLPSRYRGSCQICDKPYPERADLHFELFGMETSVHIGVRSDRDEVLQELGLGDVVVQPVTASMVERRQRTLDRLLAWRMQSRAYASAHLSPEQKTIEGLIEHLRSCPTCQNVIREHCPTFEMEWISGSGAFQGEMLENWLGYCGGCGMCEHACPEDFPIFSSIAYLSQSIDTI
jgi:formate dehydrogenase subunit beta